jgi:hypothetical protein
VKNPYLAEVLYKLNKKGCVFYFVSKAVIKIIITYFQLSLDALFTIVAVLHLHAIVGGHCFGEKV